MSDFEWLQSIILLGSLIFVAVQSWLMRRALEEQKRQLTVQSLFEIWINHIQTCHLPIATGEADTARILNNMSPYYQKELDEARKCHFADAVFDLYECVNIMGKLGILDPEVKRVWGDSVPYEMRNPNLRDHWQVLRDLQRTKRVECLGRGPGALWRKKR